MGLCFVINLTKDGNWDITRPPIFATGYVSFATTLLYQQVSTCYLQKKNKFLTLLNGVFLFFIYFFFRPFGIFLVSKGRCL